MTNPFVNAVDVFSNADRTKLPENSDPKPAAPCRSRHNESLEHSILKYPDPGSEYRMQLLSKFIEIYLPEEAHNPTRAGQSSASWVHILPDITLTNSAYNTSLVALCVAQLAIWNHDHILQKESSQLYSSALGELRKTIGALGRRKLVAPEATLASIMILSLYEVSVVASRIRTESNLSHCSSFQDRRGRILGGYTFKVVLTFYRFLGQTSVKLQ